ncbi:MAG: CocE/NonD family hydrolase, partial [Janthinobacterium lividum]
MTLPLLRFAASVALSLTATGVFAVPAVAQAAAQSDTAQVLYVRTEAMVPMRDGVKLHLVILRPQGSESGAPLPILMSRTPYGAGGSSDGLNRSKPELAKSRYIFVQADIRGKYGSEGQFVMNRALTHVPGNRTDPRLVDESSDTYDTVAWMIKNLPNNNGRVGVLGVSYPGFLAMMAGVDHHPAVKAISPQAPMTNIWLGDDFFHNGAFRQTYSYDYVLQLERAKDDQTVSMTEDTYDYFLKHVNFAGAAADAKMTALPTAKRFLTEPEYSPFWHAMAVEDHLHKPEVPTLEVGGWFDQEDMWGPQEEYKHLRAEEGSDPARKVYLALGPWNHGGWGGTGEKLGAIDFGQPTGTEYRKTIEAPFFELYLKDKPGFGLEDTASFRTGSNQWQHYAQWPPKAGFQAAKIYLGTDKSLSFTAP